ncbi:NAD-dependent epimerase/dehydratase family protein [Rhodococcoides yunnanense]|uniref:NAD(P)-dependent oxidoreductase n=1 Tax=Rhodococcoides yunnanense TaxID=278209 RepID=A0ABU4BI90_9NOCA|nr:NAD(P)-dependent oxidoreductase [Rhodococcus yunnanensis]MDV6263922.1 NAD(P)-dependent oxidoreductase [Rhodococcus yunnanensis]
MTTLVLGANGFIGSAVARELAFINPNGVLGLVRRAPADGGIPGVRYIEGDVTEASSTRRYMAGMNIVICCISYVGHDEARCQEVNDQAIRNVARAASDSGVNRLFYVSTASVYGTGPFTDMPVDGAPLNPHSEASRTRVAAEKHIRQVGGVVVRPHLILGPGDRWVAPGLMDVCNRLGSLIDGGSALVSTIKVDELARRVTELATMDSFGHDRVLHVNDPDPSRVVDVVRAISTQTNWSVPLGSISRECALERARRVGIDRRRVDMVSLDHWFRNT